MAVLPEYENRGIGKRLMELVQDWLFSHAHEEMWLLENPDPNVRAYGFYRKLCWVPAGSHESGHQILKLYKSSTPASESARSLFAPQVILIVRHQASSRLMQIDYLADHRQAIPMLASWHHDEWASRTPWLSLEDRISRLAERVGRRQIPTTFVALLGGQVVGFACLIAHDMDIRLDLSPWLASVLVMRGYRRQGIGSALTERVVEEARVLGVHTLYLYTYDQEQFYSRRGWSVLDRIEYRGEPLVIMALDIAA